MWAIKIIRGIFCQLNIQINFSSNNFIGEETQKWKGAVPTFVRIIILKNKIFLNIKVKIIRNPKLSWIKNNFKPLT